MFGQRAGELLREVAYASADALPAYNDESVRLILEELQQHNVAMLNLIRSVEEQEEARREEAGEEADTEPDWSRYTSQASAIIVHHDSILRNKRLLFTYMSKRCELIRDLRWQGRFLPEHVKSHLSPLELQYFESYNKLLTTGLPGGYRGYMSRSSDGVAMDLTLDQMPPKGPSVEVVVLEEYGEVAFSIGRANLQKGTSHLLPRDEAEPLIRSGVLQMMDT